jgi:hypothetical protein
VLYESDYLRSLQWHRIGKDSSLQGRNRMSGGMPKDGKSSSSGEPATANERLWTQFVDKLKRKDETTFEDLDIDTDWKTVLAELGGFSALDAGKLLKQIKDKKGLNSGELYFLSRLSLSLSLSLLLLFVFVAPHSHPNTSHHVPLKPPLPQHSYSVPPHHHHPSVRPLPPARRDHHHPPLLVIFFPTTARPIHDRSSRCFINDNTNKSMTTTMLIGIDSSSSRYVVVSGLSLSLSLSLSLLALLIPGFLFSVSSLSLSSPDDVVVLLTTGTRKRRRSEGANSTPVQETKNERLAVATCLSDARRLGAGVWINNVNNVSSLPTDFVARITTAHANVQTADNVCQVMGIDSLAANNVAASALDLTKLLRMAEDEFQRSDLTPWCAQHHASKVSSGFDFKYPTRVGQAGDVYTNSAIPDATSTCLPMWFEVKDSKAGTDLVANDWAVLKQALERVLTRFRLSAYLSKCIGFAVTGRSAWFICALRRDEKNLPVNIHVMRIQHADVERLWDAFTVAATDNAFFLTEDGPQLVACVKKLGFHPAQCRIRFLAESMSRVYVLSPPHSPPGFEIGVCARSAELFAIKIVRNEEEYNRETVTLKAVARVYQKGFYALGCVPRVNDGSEETDWFITQPNYSVVASQKSNLLPGAWWHFPQLPDGSGGAIVMEVASADMSMESDSTSAINGALKSLRFAHSASYVHCDVRVNNLLHFNRGGWQLVDFGHSSALNSPYKLLLSSNQRNCVGQRIIDFIASNNVSGSVEVNLDGWYAGDDYEMLMQMVIPIIGRSNAHQTPIRKPCSQ